MIERKGGLKGLTGDGGEVWNTAYALEQYKQTVADLATELNKTKKKIEVLQQILVDESRERANFERQIAEGELVPIDVVAEYAEDCAVLALRDDGYEGKITFSGTKGDAQEFAKRRHHDENTR
jgi:hypothetical protein